MSTYQKKLVVWNNFYEWCKPHIKEFRNALDIGCDTFGFAKWLEPDFQHVHCFDFRDRQSFLAKEVKNVNKLKVNITTVDKFKFANVDFIKCDVEGYETKILQGSLDTIERCNPTIVIEQNRGDFSASDLLKGLGYKHVGTWDTKGRPNDYIFVR
jgi:hypothetical protein